MGSYLESRCFPSGRSICASCLGTCGTSAQKPSSSKWWGSRGHTMRSSGGRHTRNLWPCLIIRTWNWKFPDRGVTSQ
jgi:hypothetical protein